MAYVEAVRSLAASKSIRALVNRYYHELAAQGWQSHSGLPATSREVRDDGRRQGVMMIGMSRGRRRK